MERKGDVGGRDSAETKTRLNQGTIRASHLNGP